VPPRCVFGSFVVLARCVFARFVVLARGGFGIGVVPTD
jgi:hypothetical protein